MESLDEIQDTMPMYRKIAEKEMKGEVKPGDTRFSKSKKTTDVCHK